MVELGIRACNPLQHLLVFFLMFGFLQPVKVLQQSCSIKLILLKMKQIRLAFDAFSMAAQTIQDMSKSSLEIFPH